MAEISDADRIGLVLCIDIGIQFAVMFDEKLRIAGLLPSEHGTDSLVLREQNGEKFLYGWIDGKAYWLPEKLVNEAEKLLLPAK